MSSLKILAVDTCLNACSAAVCEGERVLASAVEPMTRGHQERLAPLTGELMSKAGLRFVELDRIAVTVGPGSFTGLRVGLAFAKGLGLALGRPCVGVGALQALASAAAGPESLVAACIDAGRGQVYLQAFIDARPAMAPDVLPLEVAAARLVELFGGAPAVLAGPGAPLLHPVLPGARLAASPQADPVVVARLAAAVKPPFASPRPLYLRAPDARRMTP